MKIEDEQHYKKALARIYELIQLGTEKKPSEIIELDTLAQIVQQYEQMHYPIGINQ